MRHWLAIALLLAMLVSFGCRGRQPAFASNSSLTTDYVIEHLEIVGPTEGQSTRTRIAFFTFGAPKSFLEAEQAALEANGSELLIDRIRYTEREGVVIPLGAFLRWFFPSFPDLDMPLWVEEIWRVQGVGARYVGPRAPSTSR